MHSQEHDIENVILLQDHLKEVIFMMIVIKGIKEVVQVHRKEVFRFCLYPHLNHIQHHLKSKEVVKVLVHLKEVLRTMKWIKEVIGIIGEVVPVHLKEIDLMIILKGILSEVLIHLKEVLRII